MRTLPTAPNRANLTLGELADVYMSAWGGRDPSRTYAVAWWVRQLGDRRILDLDADAIADVLDRYAPIAAIKFRADHLFQRKIEGPVRKCSRIWLEGYESPRRAARSYCGVRRTGQRRARRQTTLTRQPSITTA